MTDIEMEMIVQGNIGEDTQVPHGNTAQALLVLGMHRSGTSALTRVFSLLGAELPKKVMPPNPHNETGYWESQDLYFIHDELLATAGSRWDDWREFNPDWIRSGVAESYKTKLLSVLQIDFAGSPLFVVKDPRICRFVPLWLDVLKQFGAETHLVIPVRNPLEVAASLKHRDNVPLTKSYILWLRHILDAEKATRHLPRAIVNYSDLLDDWRSLVGTVATKTGLYWPRRSNRSELEIDEFLTDALRHHTADFAQLTVRADVAEWVKEAYRLLLDMTGNRDAKEQFNQLDRIHTEFNKACTAFGLVLAAEAEQSESQLRSIETQVKIRDEEIAQLSGELTQARSATNEAQAAVVTSHQELETLRTIIREHESAATKLRADLDTIQSLTNSRTEEVGRLSGELQSEKAALRNRDFKIDRLSHDLEATRLVLRDSQSETQRLTGEFDRARAEIELAAAEQQRLSDIVMAKSNELEQAHGLISSLQAGRDALYLAATQLPIAREEIVALKAAREDSQQEIDRRERRINDLSRELQSAAAQAALTKSAQVSLLAAERKNAELSLELAARETDLTAGIAERESLRNQLVDVEAALAKAKKMEQNGPSWIRLSSASAKFRQTELLVKSGLFDAEWYLREYPDVAKSGLSPAEHYLEEGYLHGCRPNPLFHTRYYLKRYEDVRHAGLNPLFHYYMLGFREGRDPGPDFQTDFYLEAYPDVGSKGMNPLAHYLLYGQHEGRLPMRPV